MPPGKSNCHENQDAVIPLFIPLSAACVWLILGYKFYFKISFSKPSNILVDFGLPGAAF